MSLAGTQWMENIRFPNIDSEQVLAPDIRMNLDPYSLYSLYYHYQNYYWLLYPSLFPGNSPTSWQRYFSNLYDLSPGFADYPYENGGNCYYYYPPIPELIREDRVGSDQYYVPSDSPLHSNPEPEIRNVPSNHSSDNINECSSLPRASSTPEHYQTTDNDGTNVGPIVTIYGTISVYLRQNVRVDLTLDKAIRLVNYSTGTVVALSSDGRNISLTHPTGKLLYKNETVHFECKDISAKISPRGVLFTALKNSLIYLVDASGTKTTTERFMDMNRDISVDLFYTGSIHGVEVTEECFSSLNRHFYRSFDNGDQGWTIAGVRIRQSAQGDVWVSREVDRLTLRLSPSSGNVSATTFNGHFAASDHREKLLLARLDQKQLHYHENEFTAKNGTQKAGLDGDRHVILF